MADMKNLLLLLTGVLALLANSSADACSVSDDYRVPTNFELAKEAAVIAIVLPEKAVADDVQPSGELTVTPVHFLKGEAKASQMNIFGQFAEDRFAMPSNPMDIQKPHPLSGIGGCVRYMYIRGYNLLIFYKYDDTGELRPLFYPFARVTEDVRDENSRWAKAVKIYADISLLAEAEQKPALEKKKAELLALGDRDSLAIAADIDRAINPDPETWNASIYRQIYDGEKGNY